MAAFRGQLGKANVDDEIDDARTFYEHLDAGVLVGVEKSSGLVSMIQLHRNGTDGYKQFAGALPAGLAFDGDLASVKVALGEPATAKPSMAVYHRGGHSLAVNFDKAGRAKSVCFYA
ncbi:MAG: hypothetical protein J0L92_06865 [Deltaproteobacteria bacterium]|nr:hypothetical protein [Deltaproteobacteria bacterium]